MDLQSNRAAYFTKWVVAEGLLKAPFVLVDVGVQGGEHERWHALGDHLVVHGFDAIQEVVDALKAENQGRANRHFHCMAAGDFDGEQTLYFDPSDPFASSLYQQGESRFANAAPVAAPRSVPIHRLDTLLSDGVIPRADFLKIDVEGYEKNVLSGAREFLKGLLGFEAETTFNVSPEYPATHFGLLLDVALANHLRLLDVEFNRLPRASFQNALLRESRSPVVDQLSVGSPATANALFCRDLIEETDCGMNYKSQPPPLEIDGLIKQIIVYELYGLNDVALDTVQRFAGRLAGRMDVGKAVRLLLDPNCRTPAPLIARIRQLEGQVEHFHKTHAEVLAEAKQGLAAERQAAVLEVEKLRAQLVLMEQTYTKNIEQMERRYSTAPGPSSSQQAAQVGWPHPVPPRPATTNIVVLGRILQMIGIVVPGPMKRLIKQLPVWRRYFGSGVGL